MYEMDSVMPNSGQMHNVNGFELLDFFDNTNNNDIDHFVNLIRGETEDPFANFDHDCTHDLIGGCLVDNQLFGAPALEADMFGNFNNPVTGLLGALDHHGEMKGDDLDHDHDEDLDASDDDHDEEEDDNRQESSETNTSTAKNNKSKVDRSRTLVSERRRRGKMKEKLYALRSLVPNITKV